MTKIKIKTATLPTALPAKFYLAAAAIVLALLAIPNIGHAQGIVRGAQEGSRDPGKATGSPVRWAVWSAARSEPASVARWAPSRACSGLTIAAIAAAAITIAAVDSTAIGRFCL